MLPIGVTLEADQSGIQADRVQLQQVVLNLILNAVEAMARLGKEYESYRSGVLVAVHDSDRGLIQNIPIAFLMCSTPRNPTVWGWGYRSAGRSSMLTGAGCGQT